MAYKLLVVDDEKDIVETLQKRLSQEGYNVVVAFDGEEALVKVKEADHHLTKPCSMENILCGIETMISLIPARKNQNSDELSR